jgi:hypothetical protein
MEALKTVLALMDSWNAHPIPSLHTGISLSSILPFQTHASLDRKIPARRMHDQKGVLASNASDFAVASYSVEGLPEFSFSNALTPEEKDQSSLHWELRAISRTLDFIKRSGSLQPLEWTTLWWLTDNQNVEKYTRGSGKIRIVGDSENSKRS